MSSRQNVEIVRDQYAATNQRDFRRAMSHYADDVVMVIPAGIRGGTFEGRRAVGEWFGDWFATFDRDAQFEIAELIDLDDASVLLVAKHHATGRASGVEVEQEVVWIYRLRAGKITHLESYDSRAEALDAVGLAD
ncbi:MAG: nuclear transport factor 2 family protein [Actinobacteria bacterium]|nr:MAG: nuclear transport factor 2 family protein [Actinomycetota bacterium]